MVNDHVPPARQWESTWRTCETNLNPFGKELPAGPRRDAQPLGRAREAVRRLVPAVTRFARALRLLALAALVSGAAVWWGLQARVVAGTGREAALVLWALVLLAPPALLVVVSFAVLQILKIPARLASIPSQAGERADEVRRLASEARGVRRRGWLRSGISVLRLWRRAAASKEIVDIAGPVAFVFNLWTLALTVLAAVAAVVEIIVAAGMLVWLLVGTR